MFSQSLLARGGNLGNNPGLHLPRAHFLVGHPNYFRRYASSILIDSFRSGQVAKMERDWSQICRDTDILSLGITANEMDKGEHPLADLHPNGMQGFREGSKYVKISCLDLTRLRIKIDMLDCRLVVAIYGDPTSMFSHRLQEVGVLFGI
ncbi:hypothetical protein L1887_28394 [Cichorium endivia]|nr:hypothetical protein L1887_28394 [Cichorium endivia]